MAFTSGTDATATRMTVESEFDMSTLATGYSLSGELNKKPRVGEMWITAQLTPTAAGTAVTLIPDAAVGIGRKVYISDWRIFINGATAWSGGTGTIVKIQDTNGTPVIFSQVATAGLTGNAFIVPGTSANVTHQQAFGVNSGSTAGKGVVVVADNNYGAGSTLYVSIQAYILPV